MKLQLQIEVDFKCESERWREVRLTATQGQRDYREIPR